MLVHIPTVAIIEKATVFRKARLQTREEPNYLEVLTGTQLLLVVFDSFQKEFHIVIQFLQIYWIGNGSAGVFIPIVQE